MRCLSAWTGATSRLTGFLFVGCPFAVVALLVGPSFLLLFALHGRQVLRAGDEAMVLATGLARGTQPPSGSLARQSGSSRQPGPRRRAAAVGPVAAGVFVRHRRDR